MDFAKHCVRGMVLGAAFALIGTSAAFAVETSGVSVSNESAAMLSDLMNHLYVNYFATVHGTAFNNLDSPYTLDHNGNNTKSSFNTVNFDSEITTAYMITDDIGIGPDVPFVFVPVLGEGIILGDVGIKAIDKHFINSNGFHMSANLYLQAPTNTADKARGLFMGVKSTPGIRYDIPSSRFAVGSWNEIKWYSGVSSGKTFKLYALPYLNYQVSPSLSLNLGYEMETDHMNGSPGFFNFTGYENDLQPGVVWFVTSKIMVNPYVQVFTGNTINTGTTGLGAVVSATL